MRNTRFAAVLTLIGLLVAAALAIAFPVQASVVSLQLERRSCGQFDAFATYDGFSEGKPAYYVVFAVDINNDGKYGQAGEPIRYIKVIPGGGQRRVGSRIAFKPLPENSMVGVTAYELDEAGVPLSSQLEPVRYQCTQRPDIFTLPQNTGVQNPTVGVVAKVNVARIIVYSAPTTRSTQLGGLGRGALLDVVSKNERGDWVQINYKGTLGWIMWQKQVILLGQHAKLPAAPNAERYTPTPLPQPTATPTR